MSAPTQSAGPMVFVESLDRPELDDGDRHHLERVLRVQAADPIVLCDGGGGWRMARFGPEVEIDGEVVTVPAPERSVTVGFALLKGDRPELICQKLTELGVDRIVPMSTDHCVVRWEGPKASRQRERLVAVARAAAMQCRRTHLPLVEPVSSYADLVASPTAGMARGDFDGSLPTEAFDTILVGPEGGWSTTERDAWQPAVRLATHVLRAESAAIVAGTILTGFRDGLFGPTGVS